MFIIVYEQRAVRRGMFNIITYVSSMNDSIYKQIGCLYPRKPISMRPQDTVQQRKKSGKCSQAKYTGK